jgi:hypothetical protein
MPKLRGLGIALLVGAALFAPAAARAAPPPNDAFAAAQELTGAATAAEGLSKDATKETGEPDHAGDPGGASIWYRWTAPSAGRVVVSTCGSGFDTLLGVYTGDALDALAEVASNDDACGLQSEASFAAVEGVTYRIAVDGVDGDSGLVSLAVRLAPPNDDFDDATALHARQTSRATSTTASGTAGPRRPPVRRHSRPAAPPSTRTWPCTRATKWIRSPSSPRATTRAA